MTGGTEEPRKPWKLTYQDRTYHERDLTLDQMERAEDILGRTWHTIGLLTSAKIARTILAIYHSDATGRSYDEVYAELGLLPTEEFLTKVWGVAVDDDPEYWEDGNPQVAEPSTSTSERSASRRGAGRQP